MALNFPDAPTVNQSFAGPNGIVWVWDGTKWISGTGTNVAYAPLKDPVFTGDPRAPTPGVTDNDTSIANTAFVQSNMIVANNNKGRNLFHNPLFNIAQRGAGPWSGAQMTCDRWAQWFQNGSQTSQRIVADDGNRSQIGDEAAKYFFQTNFIGSATVGSANVFYQNIEHVHRLANKTVTVSFWAVGSAILKLGVSIDQKFGSGGSPSAGVGGTGKSVTVTQAFVRYSLTFNVPSVAGKTLGTNGDDSTAINFWFSAPSPSSDGVSGSVGVQSGTIYLWGMQVEVGSVMTPLDKPDPQVELANCQRFYQTGYFTLGVGGVAGVNNSGGSTYITQMRVAPTMVIIGNPSYTNASAGGIAYNNNINYTAYAMVGVTGYANFTLTWTASADI
jgi:hypothetical protein